MSAKYYPLCIEEPLSDGDGYYSKGHHDPVAFLETLNNELADGGELDYLGSDPWDLEYAQFVEQMYWRKGQDAFSREEEWAWTVYKYSEPGRGRFPVTVLYTDRALYRKRKQDALRGEGE